LLRTSVHDRPRFRRDSQHEHCAKSFNDFINAQRPVELTDRAMPNLTDDVRFLRQQAQRCRRLAKQMTDDMAVTSLHSMADEYEAEAARLNGLAKAR
jgi:hypothetical protein